MTADHGDFIMGRKDGRESQIVLGILLPTALLLHTAYCLAVGEVFCLRGGTGRLRHALIWADDPLRFWFWIPCQVAAVIAMVSWFLLANHRSLEHLALPGVALAVLIAAGTAIVSLGRTFFF